MKDDHGAGGDGVRLKVLLILGAALLFIGCVTLVPGGNPGLPTPSPGTPPMDPSPICHPPDLVRECYVRPPGEPWSYLCKDGATKVTGPAECPAPTTPPAACVIPDEGAVKSTEPADTAAVAAVNAAALKVAGCAEGPPSRCVVAQPMGAFLAAVVAELRAGGRCAGIQSGADEVAVLLAPGKAQGFHVFACGPTCARGTVAWAPGSVRDVWSSGGPPPVTPPATCTEPTPDATLFKLDVRWNSARTVAWVDATPKANAREWCEEHFGPAGPWPNQNNRVVCPSRPEGHPERKACDEKHGRPIWLVEGQVAPSDPGDSFHIHVSARSKVQACRVVEPAPRDCSEPLVVNP